MPKRLVIKETNRCISCCPYFEEGCLLEQYKLNKDILEGVEGALAHLTADHSAAELLKDGESLLKLRQSHLQITDTYD